MWPALRIHPSAGEPFLFSRMSSSHLSFRATFSAPSVAQSPSRGRVHAMRLVRLGALPSAKIGVVFFEIPIGMSNIRNLFC
jgi:hypothetical protein